MKNIFKLSILIISCALLAACNTTSSSNNTSASNSPSRTLASKIDKSKIKGFSGNGREGIYICHDKPSCKIFQLVIYQAKRVSATSLSQLKSGSSNPKTLEAQLKLGFAIAGAKRGSTIKLDGKPSRTTVKGQTAYVFYLKGKKRNKQPRDPGYMVMVLGKSKVHIFFGISKTKSQAKNATMKIVNAWRP